VLDLSRFTSLISPRSAECANADVRKGPASEISGAVISFASYATCRKKPRPSISVPLPSWFVSNPRRNRQVYLSES